MHTSSSSSEKSIEKVEIGFRLDNTGWLFLVYYINKYLHKYNVYSVCFKIIVQLVVHLSYSRFEHV